MFGIFLDDSQIERECERKNMTTRVKMCLPQEEKCIDSVCCIANYLIQECSFGYCFAELQFKPHATYETKREWNEEKTTENSKQHCITLRWTYVYRQRSGIQRGIKTLRSILKISNWVFTSAQHTEKHRARIVHVSEWMSRWMDGGYLRDSRICQMSVNKCAPLSSTALKILAFHGYMIPNPWAQSKPNAETTKTNKK